MNCKFSRKFLIMPALFVLASCGSNKAPPEIHEPIQAENSVVEQPIEVIITQGEKSADIAPVAPALAVDTPAVIPLAPVFEPVFASPVPPPIPVGVIVDEGACEDFFCGDGNCDEGEECDDGNDDIDDDCDNFCRKIRCGNDRVEGDEECDDKDNINCTKDCKLKLCGNGKKDPNETCDPPNETTKCNSDCLTSVCGNDIVEFGEQCDDGNDVETDGCNNECELSCPTKTEE